MEARCTQISDDELMEQMSSIGMPQSMLSSLTEAQKQEMKQMIQQDPRQQAPTYLPDAVNDFSWWYHRGKFWRDARTEPGTEPPLRRRQNLRKSREVGANTFGATRR